MKFEFCDICCHKVVNLAKHCQTEEHLRNLRHVSNCKVEQVGSKG